MKYKIKIDLEVDVNSDIELYEVYNNFALELQCDNNFDSIKEAFQKYMENSFHYEDDDFKMSLSKMSMDVFEDGKVA